MSGPDTATVVVKAYDAALWLLRKVEKFPRSHRLTVGDRIVGEALELLMTLVDASYSRDKRGHLLAANSRLNRLRYLLRIAKDLRLLSLDGWSFSAESLDEIGRMIGGWLKQRREPA